ncbi:related to D-arabinose 1-dehydrogenase [Hanseniaspora guilliermondii]|uniref:Related to D-arabinose 1-dehydrogenase n=1 Tax=Hanseniaspora guilliermondii TaxID=56406 RepID=A0A1L0CHY1_9ASCO|nr:related to D-arabinose 1-dehydrogenase [Hanseniaspora guilliermondii]
MEISDILPITLGGATLNVQYNDDPQSIPLLEMVERAFSSGICNSIDTSPYYGDSEMLYGKVLQHLNYTNNANSLKRKSIFVITKCGRIRENEFDYTYDAIISSIKRSIRRLFGQEQSEFLDLVYLHDIEFQTMDQRMEALKALKDLKTQGLIRFIGCSGYPISFIYETCIEFKKRFGESLDGTLSYSNGCLQNDTLFDNEVIDQRFFKECGLKVVSNGSILSMSMLSQHALGIKPFHPCQKIIREMFDFNVKSSLNQQLLQILDKYHQRLPLLATKFAIIKNFQYNLLTVVGISNLEEWNDCESIYKNTMSNDFKFSTNEELCIKEIDDLMISNGIKNLTWNSGYYKGKD